MGAGASTPRERGHVADSKERASRQEKQQVPEAFTESSPFDNGGEFGLDYGSAAADKLTMSPAKLKKLALGLPGYKEVDRDYNATLEELEFNKSQVADWVAPPEGFGDKKPERLVDDYPYGRGSGSSGSKHPQHDARAAAGRLGAAAAARGAPSGPTGRPRPPPPRRPSNPSPVVVPQPQSQNSVGSQISPQPASQQVVDAPSVLQRPRAPMDTTPVMGGGGGNKQYWPAPGAVPTPSISSFSSSSPAPDSAQSYRRPSHQGQGQGQVSTPPSSADGEIIATSGRPSLRTTINSPGTPTRRVAPSVPFPAFLPDAPKDAPPLGGIPSRPFPGTKSAGGSGMGTGTGTGQTPALSTGIVDDTADDIYATFAPAQPQTPEAKRPSFVPALVISSPSSSRSSSVSAPSAASASASSLPRPSQPRNPSISGPGGSSAVGPPLSSTPKQGPPNVVRTLDPVSGAVLSKSSANAPPKPMNKAPHEVKETTDIRRNRAQLPSQLIHAKPTTGDWLKKRYIVNNYILLDVLGVGSYGEVRMCKDRTTDQLYAIKIFSKDMLKKKKNGNTVETYFEDIRREIAIMKKLLHPNVLRLFEVLDDPNVNKMYLVLEYMKKGDLIAILKTRGEGSSSSSGGAGGGGGADKVGGVNGDKDSDPMKSGFVPLSDFELWNIFRQVAAGVRYLHYQNIVHGDIKPQNLLVGEDGVVKIADFGISKMLHGSGAKLTDAAGTPAFMAPELFDSGKAFSGQLSDIWAMGATMFMLRFGHPPFIAKNIVKLSEKIQNDPLVFPQVIDDALRDLLENMLHKDPSRRFTLQQVIMHKWMRLPPANRLTGLGGAAHGPVLGSVAAAGTGAGAGAATTGVGAGVSTKEGGATEGGAAGRRPSDPPAASFMPPASYANEEAKAMERKVEADDDDIFMSIGMRSAAKSIKRAVSGEEDDEDNDNEGAKEEDVMATAWGADVFEMVDDDAGGGSDSDDDGDGDAGMATGGSAVTMTTSGAAKPKMRRGSKDGLAAVAEDFKGEAKVEVRDSFVSSPRSGLGPKADAKNLQSSSSASASFLLESKASVHTEMSQEEEERRARRFQEASRRRGSFDKNAASNENGQGTGIGPSSAAPKAEESISPPMFRTGLGERGEFGLVAGLAAGTGDASAKQGGGGNGKLSLEAGGPGSGSRPSPIRKELSVQIPDGPVSRTPGPGHAPGPGSGPGPGPPHGPPPGGPRYPGSPSSTRARGLSGPRSPGGGAYDDDDEEGTEQLTMEQFQGLMDTLARQPQKDLDSEAVQPVQPVQLTLKPSTFSALLRNPDNAVGAAWHSEQGRRDSQEDRCVLLPDLSAMKALENQGLSSESLDQLRRFSLAAVFDGHSGWRCSQYLSQNMAPLLALHPKFLDKQPDAAVLDVFKAVDEQACHILRSEGDPSGSTGVVAIYDGRRHVLTVANVGDSMCVLSRGGRAVRLHRQHRLGPEDSAERSRVENAGGAVINNRVGGVLAVSRAFGDTQFKEPAYNPVIAVPDLVSEVITPMTEFGIVATDGLWDVVAPQLAVNFVRKKLSKRADLQECSRELVQEAVARGSVDNITVLLMTFHMHDKEKDKDKEKEKEKVPPRRPGPPPIRESKE